MFNQLQFSADQIAGESARTAQALEASLGAGTDAPRYAAQVIAHRLRVHPEAYLEFGPYWWAVKAAMKTAGEDFGEEDDALVRASYGAGLPLLDTLVAGELFKDYYRRMYFVGACQYWLDDGAEESYVLFDSDMAARMLGVGGAKVAANLQAIQQPADPENAY